MAIVPNLADPSAVVDKPYTSPNRIVTGPVAGVVVPEYVGELILDDANHQTYKAINLTTDGWQEVEVAI